MIRRGLASVVVIGLASVALSSPTVAGRPGQASSRYLVVLEDDASVVDVADAARLLGARVDDEFGAVNTLLVSLPPNDVKRLRGDPRVAYVAPDRFAEGLAAEIRLSPVPTGVARIGADSPSDLDAAAEPSGPDRRAAVAVLDTGVSPRSDLNVAGGVDCSSSPPDHSGDGTRGTSDPNGHGTHVAGIVAGKGTPGVVGVSPGTPIFAVRVFGPDGSGPISDLVCGLDWVAEHAAAEGIKVVNLSLGGPGSDDGNCGHSDHDALHTAVCRLTAAGVTVVAAAGNEGQDLAHSTPAAYGEVLAVTAMADFDGRPGGFGSPPSDCGTSNNDDTAAGYSNYAVPGSVSAEHTIAAPGDCITATWNDGATKTISGTSMASPHVAGLVARCLDTGACAGLSPAQIIAKLRADAASRPIYRGFLGDPVRPKLGKYYGYLATGADN